MTTTAAASTDADDRNASIWSTRVQRELLALTTDDAEATTEHSRAMLPPFVKVREHLLNIADAVCTIPFDVTVPGGGAQTGCAATTSSESRTVVVQLDASLPHGRDGSIVHGKSAYPFVEPVATLVSGQEHFPDGSTIQIGDRIGMDIEWTPSLHMADAITNVALKIKESLLQSEPFHPVPPEPQAASTNPLQDFLDPVDEVAKSARRIASSFSGIGKAFASQARTPRQVSEASSSSPATPSPTAQAAKKKKGKGGGSGKPATAPVTNPENVRIGDDIHLLDEPWVDAHGVYACKAIRRPTFISDAMAVADERSEQQSFASPTAMFRSFTKSARTVLQDSFLMITETHLIEMKSSKLNPTTATVTFCISIDLMHKLKFRRGESLSLFFKPAPDDPLVYMCPDSGDAVHQIQAVLKRHGVKGKHTNAAAHRAIAEAMHIIQEIQTKELALKHDPCVERVNEIMDLYRQAAERFAVAGDLRHEEVVTHLRKFLALPLTASILDGTFQKPEPKVRLSSGGGGGGDDVPEGEVLERTPCQIEDDHDEDGPKKTSHERSPSDRDFEDSMDSLLKEAQADLQKLKADSGDTLDTSTSEMDGVADVAADLDEMMRKADAELAELMKG